MRPPEKVQRPGGIRGEAAEQTEAHDTQSKHSTRCMVCAIPSPTTLCAQCSRWILLEQHVRAAARLVRRCT